MSTSPYCWGHQLWSNTVSWANKQRNGLQALWCMGPGFTSSFRINCRHTELPTKYCCSLQVWNTEASFWKSGGTLDDAEYLKLPRCYINYYSVYSSIISALLHFNSRWGAHTNLNEKMKKEYKWNIYWYPSESINAAICNKHRVSSALEWEIQI